MKITILIDNNTLIDRYFIGEPGVSYFIEADNKTILFDVGYSDAFIKNAEKLNKDIFNIDFLAISHSHLDHTWGLEPYIKRLTERIFENMSISEPEFVAHPAVFDSKTFFGNDEFGINIDKNKISKYFKSNLSKDPVWLTENLVFLGEIPRENDFESMDSIGKVFRDGKYIEDFNIDDSALCYKSDKGLVVITGCSHSGICNIIEYAKVVCNDNRIYDVIGGFHLQNPPEHQMDNTIDYFSKLNTDKIHACHCTDLKSKIALSSVVEVEEVGVGLVLNY